MQLAQDGELLMVDSKTHRQAQLCAVRKGLLTLQSSIRQSGARGPWVTSVTVHIQELWVWIFGPAG